MSVDETMEEEEVGRTDATNDEWYEEPCSFSANLEDVVEGCDGEEGDKDDRSHKRRFVAVEDETSGVVDIGMRFSHFGCCSCMEGKFLGLLKSGMLIEIVVLVMLMVLARGSHALYMLGDERNKPPPRVMLA